MLVNGQVKKNLGGRTEEERVGELRELFGLTLRDEENGANRENFQRKFGVS